MRKGLRVDKNGDLIVNDIVVDIPDSGTFGTAAANTDVGALTATNPTAPAAYTAHASGSVPVTSNAATDLDTTAAALAALRAEVATYETAISALVVDVAAQRTTINALQAKLRTAGLLAT